MTSKGKRCRSYATIQLTEYTPTCRAHKNHFKGDLVSKWIHKRILTNLEFYPARRIYIESALQLGLAHVKKQHILQIPQHTSYTYFILLCARHTEFMLDWNSQLSFKVIGTLWKRVGSIGPVVITYEDLFSMFRTNIVAGFYAILLAYPHHTPMNWFDFFERCSENPWFQEFLHYSHKNIIDELGVHLKKIYLGQMVEPQSHTLLHIFESGEFFIWLLNKKKAFYLSLESRIEPIKEELLAVSWSPERVMEWCMDHSQRDFWASGLLM